MDRDGEGRNREAGGDWGEGVEEQRGGGEGERLRVGEGMGGETETETGNDRTGRECGGVEGRIHVQM